MKPKHLVHIGWLLVTNLRDSASSAFYKEDGQQLQTVLQARRATCCKSSPNRSKIGLPSSTRSSNAMALRALAKAISRLSSKPSSASKTCAAIYNISDTLPILGVAYYAFSPDSFHTASHHHCYHHSGTGTYLLTTVVILMVIGTIYSISPLRLKRFSLWAAISIALARGVIANVGVYQVRKGWA